MTITLTEAIDEFRKHMQRRGFATTSQQRYDRELCRFAKYTEASTPLDEVTSQRVQEFLDSFDRHAPSTVDLEFTILSSFFRHMVKREFITTDPMQKLERPKVPALRDRKRTRVTQEQVEMLLAACETWPEKMAVYSLAYLGLRRSALARARWGDVDGKARTISVLEKGGKRREKPIPDALWRVWTQYAIERGPVAPEDWLVPNRRDTGRRDERSNRVVWYLVKDVAKRADIEVHCHAFRSAFAVQFLRENPQHFDLCRQLLGHASMNTTVGYQDELEAERLREHVGGLSYRKGAA